MVQHNPLRIVHVAAPAAYGGAERVLEALACGHAARGHRVDVVAVVAPGSDTPATWRASFPAAGVTLHTVVVQGRGYADERREVIRVLRACNADVAHSHGYRADVISSSVTGVTARRVSTVHGFTSETGRVRLYEMAQRFALRRFDAVVAVSAPLRERLQESGIAAPRLHLVRNGWDGAAAVLPRAEARRVLGIPADTFVAGWVGRLSTEKGCDVALDALAAMTDDTRLSIVGDGPEKAALLQRASRLGLGERVQWHGMVPGAGRLLGAFDVLLLSSRTEGTPMILLEAMAAGTPIIATAVGGVPDLVSAECGFLVPTEDPHAIAAAARAVRTCPEEARTRAARARTRLEIMFGPEEWLGRYETLYVNVLTRGVK